MKSGLGLLSEHYSRMRWRAMKAEARYEELLNLIRAHFEGGSQCAAALLKLEIAFRDAP